MSYDVKVLADSISEGEACRITTMEVTFPRPYLAEMNTHTLFSRNSASSRAIPPEKMIERVLANPYVPETFNARVKGMGVGDALDDQERCRKTWLRARDEAVEAAGDLLVIGVDKSRINRLLEPFMWHTAIITATEWDNFMSLRQPDEGDVPNIHFPAQPEMQIIARMMRMALRDSTPQLTRAGEWGHLPLVPHDAREWQIEHMEGVDRMEFSDKLIHHSEFPHPLITVDYDIEDRLVGISAVGPQRETLRVYAAMLSGGRCARVSFDTHEDYEPHVTSFMRALRLRGSGHMSPFQHPARPFTDEEWEIVRRQQELIREFCEYTRQSAGREGIPETVEVEMVRRAEFCGNYRGWVQLRKVMPGEWNFAEAVAKQLAPSS